MVPVSIMSQELHVGYNQRLTKWAQRSAREAIKIYVEAHTGTVCIGRRSNVTADACRVAVGQNGSIGHSSWVVGGDFGIAQFTRGAWNDRSINASNLSTGEREGRNGGKSSECVHFERLW